MKRFLLIFVAIVVTTWIWLRKTIYSEHNRTMGRSSDTIRVAKKQSKKKQASRMLRSKPKKMVIKQQSSTRLAKTLAEFEEEKFEPYDEEGNIYITKVLIDEGLAIAHGDLVVGTFEEVTEAQKNGAALKIQKPGAWPSNTIAYRISPEIGPEQTESILYVLSEFNRLTNLSFIEQTDQEDFINFKPTKNNCYAFVGHQGGAQDILLSPLCDNGKITHEILHTLGFHHEHSRPDRDEHVYIYWENIKEEFHPQFKKLPWDNFDLERFSFDPNSIMNYPGNAFAIEPDKFSITAITGDPFVVPNNLSLIDIEKVNYLYPTESQD